MNNKKSRNQSIKKNSNAYDTNDVEILKARLITSEKIIEELTKEKDNMKQETENDKYQLMQKNKELEEQLTNRNTELRRQAQKLVTLEKEFKIYKNDLSDEKKKIKEMQKQMESVSKFFFNSFSYCFGSFTEVKRIFKDTLVSLG